MGNMFGGIGDGFVGLFRFMTVLLYIFVPLGMWKLVELIILMLKHVKFT